MDSLLQFIASFSSFAIVIIILVFFHELGHFLVARLCGVHVEVFAVGLGPRICSFVDRHNTTWQLSILPLGGYVRMLGGEAILDPNAINNIPEAQRNKAFPTKNLWQRSAIVAAGPLANILLSLVIFIFVFTSYGSVEPAAYLETGVGKVQEQSPAEKAGIKEGDIITRIGDMEIYSFADLRNAMQQTNGGTTKVLLTRGLDTLQLELTPNTQQLANGDIVYLMGVFSPSGKLVEHNIFSATGQAFQLTKEITLLIGETLRDLILPGLRDSQSVGVSSGGANLAGPVGIASMARDALSGGVVVLAMTIAIWSINLAVFNLLPIPVLDGGHLALFLIEGITGRPVHHRVQQFLTATGIAILLALFIYVTYGDILRLLS